MAEISTHQQLDQMITGYWISQAIYAAAKFGIADHLKNGPKTVGDLAAATSTNPDAMYRLLRALASIGIFTEGESRLFSLTPLAEPLQSDIAGSKRALALMSGDEQFRAWAEIDYSLRTGKTAFDKVFGKPVFDYLGDPAPFGEKVVALAGQIDAVQRFRVNEPIDRYGLIVLGTQLVQLGGIDHGIVPLGVLITGDDVVLGHLAVNGAGLLVLDTAVALGVELVKLDVPFAGGPGVKRLHGHGNERKLDVALPGRRRHEGSRKGERR
jgi:hypothetical protein